MRRIIFRPDSSRKIPKGEVPVIALGLLHDILVYSNLHTTDRRFLDLEVLLVETFMFQNTFAVQDLLPHSHQLPVEVGFIFNKLIDVEINV